MCPCLCRIKSGSTPFKTEQQSLPITRRELGMMMSGTPAQKKPAAPSNPSSTEMMPQSGSLQCFDNPQKTCSEPEPTSQVSEANAPETKLQRSIGVTQAYDAGSDGVCQTAYALKKADPTKGRPTDESDPGDQTTGPPACPPGIMPGILAQNHDGDRETSSGEIGRASCRERV